MEICVFGAGSLGSLVGGVLARTHDVTLVGREPHVSATEADGLRICGELSETVQPSAQTTPPTSAELAIVTVKSFDTATAVDALADCSLDGVLSLQNGMGNEKVLANGLLSPVLAGTCTYGARLTDPGVVECTGIGEIVLGPHEGGDSPFAERVWNAFVQADLVTTLSDEMPRRLWEKLAVNAGINATTALARIPNGELLDGPASSVANEATRETARVARRQGIDLADSDAVEQTRTVADATAANTSSMQQDILKGKRTEIDAINGYVVENSEEAVPVNETLTELVRAWERSQGVRPDGARSE